MIIEFLSMIFMYLPGFIGGCVGFLAVRFLLAFGQSAKVNFVRVSNAWKRTVSLSPSVLWRHVCLLRKNRCYCYLDASGGNCARKRRKLLRGRGYGSFFDYRSKLSGLFRSEDNDFINRTDL